MYVIYVFDYKSFKANKTDKWTELIYKSRLMIGERILSNLKMSCKEISYLKKQQLEVSY